MAHKGWLGICIRDHVHGEVTWKNADGGRDAIDAMLEAIVPAMKAMGGGWMACLDLNVLPGTSPEDFKYCVQ